MISTTLVKIDDKTLGTALRIAGPARAVEKRHQPSSLVPALASRDRWEEYCLSLLLQHQELRDKAEGILPDHFGLSDNRAVFFAWRNASDIMALPITDGVSF